MHHRGMVLLGLWAVLLSGCVTGGQALLTSALSPGQPFQGPNGPDVVQMETALLEGPVGDPFFNQDLWTLTDDQVVDLDRKALLQANGLRVGQVGGLTPARLQALLASDRSCVNPRLIQTHAEHSTRLSVGPPLPVCRFQIHQDEPAAPMRLEQAECTLVVVPSLMPGGQVRLRFTPEIPHGRPLLFPQPADRAAWVLGKQQPTESFPGLSWEVTLAPNEYVIVGGRYDRPETLGHQFFIRTQETPPRQRLLVIRTARPVAGLLPDASAPADASGSRSPPLALQAAWPTGRAVNLDEPSTVRSH